MMNRFEFVKDVADWVWASGVHGIKRPQRMLGANIYAIIK